MTRTLPRDSSPTQQKRFTLAGRVYRISPTIQVGRAYDKAELILSVDNTRHLQAVFLKQNPIRFEFAQELADLLAPYKPGDEVTVSFTIDGREYTRDGQTLFFVVLLGEDIYLTDEGPAYNKESGSGYVNGTIRLGDQLNTLDIEPPF